MLVFTVAAAESLAAAGPLAAAGLFLTEARRTLVFFSSRSEQ